ncbi:hypothetical protein CYMTET_10114 [Cymbomonas tetramitiformis]|uniref:CN hydrolase domain-containing protein n=1 Tax=Cymbomonas tetramitiformis TaxID=36881 RepID=A0AAE0GRD2_9CHLO|nr:hypothetical protein CYMTET_10114 [Cymbomonas tetramitiformis]|eukprot:gene27492-33908_t
MFVLLLTTLLLSHLSAAYKIAYVEHQATSACGAGSCGPVTKAKNVRTLVDYAAKAARAGADIIVFPEYGITGFSSYPKRSWISGGYVESWTTASGIPCDLGRDFRDAPSVVTLSCAARANKIALVANLVHYTVQGYVFNTDVVFDTDGTFLAFYHKQNLWGEANMDVPQDCPEVEFTPSFGVRFGLITCADLIYQQPALELVMKGIKHFILPAAWSDDMAQMQVLGYAQGWSLRTGVTLTVCNQRTSTESGSGVFVAGSPASYVFSLDSKEGTLHFAQVDAEVVGNASEPVHSKVHMPHTVPVAQREVLLNGTEEPSKIRMSGRWTFAPLAAGEVCTGSKSVCCEANITGGGAAGFVLAAVDGQDKYSDLSWGAMACAILPCAAPGPECLSYHKPTGTLTSIILATTMPSGAWLVPEVIGTARHGSGQTLLEAGSTRNAKGGHFDFTATEGGKTRLVVQADDEGSLSSVIIYGREFARDPLPYTCPQQSPHGNL